MPLALLLLCASAAAQPPLPALLIVSQPVREADRAEFVDLAPFLERTLRESGKFQVVVFKPTLPALREALNAKKIGLSDIEPPLSPENARKVAVALDASFLLRVSARRTKEGVATEAQFEARMGKTAWTTVFSSMLTPYKPKDRPAGLLDGIYAHTAALCEPILGAPPGLSPPGATKTQTVAPPPPDKAADRKGGETETKPPPDQSDQKPRIENPRSAPPSANEILVNRFRRQGDSVNLIVSLRRAIDDKPRDARLRRDLVRAYRERGWHAAARDEALRAVALLPEDASLRRLLGDGYLDMGDTEAAIREYQEAVRLGGKEAANHVALGDAYWNSARPEEAQRAYQAAAEAEPNNPVPYRRLARLFMQRGRYGDCIAAMKRARERTTEDASEDLVADYILLLNTAEANLNDLFAGLQRERRDFVSGAHNREETFQGISAQQKRAQELADFLLELPAPTGYAQVQAIFAQAATLTVQSAENALQYLATQNENHDREATILRLEAARQLSDAAKRLKTIIVKKPTG